MNGQGLVEYALLLALIAVVAIVILTVLGHDIAVILGRIGDQLCSNTRLCFVER